jgi:predicted Rossmann-fold nucleotide-binding protein
MPTLRRLCVYAGSNVGARPEYAAAAVALAERMGLVYEGGKVGLMGVLADTVGHRAQAASVLLEALRQQISLIHRSRSSVALGHSTRPLKSSRSDQDPLPEQRNTREDHA